MKTHIKKGVFFSVQTTMSVGRVNPPWPSKKPTNEENSAPKLGKRKKLSKSVLDYYKSKKKEKSGISNIAIYIVFSLYI